MLFLLRICRFCCWYVVLCCRLVTCLLVHVFIMCLLFLRLMYMLLLYYLLCFSKKSDLAICMCLCKMLIAIRLTFALCKMCYVICVLFSVFMCICATLCYYLSWQIWLCMFICNMSVIGYCCCVWRLMIIFARFFICWLCCMLTVDACVCNLLFVFLFCSYVQFLILQMCYFIQFELFAVYYWCLWFICCWTKVVDGMSLCPLIVIVGWVVALVCATCVIWYLLLVFVCWC